MIQDFLFILIYGIVLLCIGYMANNLITPVICYMVGVILGLLIKRRWLKS